MVTSVSAGNFCNSAMSSRTVIAHHRFLSAGKKMDNRDRLKGANRSRLHSSSSPSPFVPFVFSFQGTDIEGNKRANSDEIRNSAPKLVISKGDRVRPRRPLSNPARPMRGIRLSIRVVTLSGRIVPKLLRHDRSEKAHIPCKQVVSRFDRSHQRPQQGAPS